MQNKKIVFFVNSLATKKIVIIYLDRNQYAINRSYTEYIPCSKVTKSFSSNPRMADCTELADCKLYFVCKELCHFVSIHVKITIIIHVYLPYKSFAPSGCHKKNRNKK